MSDWVTLCVLGGSLLCYHGAKQPFTPDFCEGEEKCLRYTNGITSSPDWHLMFIVNCADRRQGREDAESRGLWCCLSVKFTPRESPATVTETCRWLPWLHYCSPSTHPVLSVFRCNGPSEDIRTYTIIASLLSFLIITNISVTTDRLYLLFLVGSTNPGRILQGNSFDHNPASSDI